MGITDIIYSEIGRYRDKKLEEKERREIAYGMIKKILRSFKNGWEIHMSSEFAGYFDDEIEVYVSLLNDTLSEAHDMIIEDIRVKTLDVAKAMHKCAKQIKGIGRENWEKYISCVENSIKQADKLIEEIDSVN